MKLSPSLIRLETSQLSLIIPPLERKDSFIFSTIAKFQIFKIANCEVNMTQDSAMEITMIPFEGIAGDLAKHGNVVSPLFRIV